MFLFQVILLFVLILHASSKDVPQKSSPVDVAVNECVHSEAEEVRHPVRDCLLQEQDHCVEEGRVSGNLN